MKSTSEPSGGDDIWFTAGKLIEILKTFPQDIPVLVNGIESGYENFYHPSVVKMKHVPDNWYKDGEFEVCHDGGEGTFDAVLLERVNRDD